VFRMFGRMTLLLIDRATIFDRKVGIEPIEGVLERTVLRALTGA
jgi:hypothetical protein